MEAQLVKDFMAKEQVDEINRQADLAKRKIRREQLADRYTATIIPKMEAKESEKVKLSIVYLKRKQEAEERAIKLKEEKDHQLKMEYMAAIHAQVVEKERRDKEEHKRKVDSELKEFLYVQEKERRQIALEDEKKAARWKSAHELMLEAKKSMKPVDRSAIVKITHGQKMSKDEFLMNRELLKEVAQVKRQGEFNKLKEFSSTEKA